MSNVNQLAARVRSAAGSTAPHRLSPYALSILAVNSVCLRWETADDLGDDVAGTLFVAFVRAKEAHRAAFGSLHRVQGEWI